MSVGKNGRTLVVMPTLNERLLFEGVMQGIAALDIDKDSLHVLLVDDDSQDQTWRNYGTHWAAEDARFYLMRRTGRFKGQGSALKDAIGWAVDHENQYEYLAVIAGNQTDDPAFLPAMIGKLEAGADVVVAQRSEQPGGEAGSPRRIAPVMSRLAAGVPFTDVESGYRAFRIEALQKLPYTKLKRVDQGVKLELLARAKRAGLRLDTVDVPLIPRGPQCEFRGGTTGFVGAKLLWIKRTLGLL